MISESAGARLLLLVRTVCHLRPRQIFFRLLRRGPVPRLTERITGPPWRRCRSWATSPSRNTNVDTTPLASANPFAAAPDPPAVLTGTELVVDGVPAPIEPAAWVGVSSAENGASRFRLYRLHSHLFLAHRNTGLDAARVFLDRYLPVLFAEDAAVECNTVVDASRRIAWEAHPLSLRLISWVRYAHRVTTVGADLPERFDTAIACQARHLARRIEYETDGNHLIDNAVALVLAGSWLGGGGGMRAYRRGLRLLLTELPRQLLPDGFHDERSPMYHRLMTERVLDVLAVLPPAAPAGGDVEQLTGRMLRRVGLATDAVGTDPALNDHFPGMAPTSRALSAYAAAIGVEPWGARASLDPATDVSDAPRLHDVTRGPFRVLFDADAIGPDHVPGHAHADTLQVLLWHEGRNTIVDTGVSTYDPGERRDYERSTPAHNTVTVAGENSSDMWGSFRVGRRARVVSCNTIVDTAHMWHCEAVHDGYRRRGALHRRSVAVSPERVVVTDRVEPRPGASVPTAGAPNRAYWHLAPEIAGSLQRISASRVALAGLEIEFRDPTKFDFETCEIAAGFEKRVESVTIVVEFESTLETVIEAGQ